MKFIPLALFGCFYAEATVESESALGLWAMRCGEFDSQACLDFALALTRPYTVSDYPRMRQLASSCAKSMGSQCQIGFEGEVVVKDSDLCTEGSAGWNMPNTMAGWSVTSVKVNKDLSSCSAAKGYYSSSDICSNPAKGTEVDIKVTENSITIGDGKGDGYPAQVFVIPDCSIDTGLEFTLGIKTVMNSAQAIMTGGLFIAAAAFVL